jgi:hypothetical protein
MFRSLVAAVVGAVLGAGVGCLAAWVLYGSSAPERGWTSYRTLAEETRAAQGVAFHKTEVGPPEFHSWLFAGFLYGGGLGLVAGSVVGAAGAIVAAIKEGDSRPLQNCDSKICSCWFRYCFLI